jgi:hypothetical protein
MPKKCERDNGRGREEVGVEKAIGLEKRWTDERSAHEGAKREL